MTTAPGPAGQAGSSTRRPDRYPRRQALEGTVLARTGDAGRDATIVEHQLDRRRGLRVDDDVPHFEPQTFGRRSGPGELGGAVVDGEHPDGPRPGYRAAQGSCHEASLKPAALKRARLEPAGLKQAGLKQAGLNRARLKPACPKRPGLKRAGLKRTGLKRTGLNNVTSTT